MNKIIFVVAILIVLALNTGCESINYEFGDVSRIYCGTTNEEIRANIKTTLSENGLKIDVDYCSSAGLVDALLIKSNQKRN